MATYTRQNTTKPLTEQQKRIQGYARNPLALEAMADRTRPLNLTEREMLTLLHDMELIYMGMADSKYPLR